MANLYIGGFHPLGKVSSLAEAAQKMKTGDILTIEQDITELFKEKTAISFPAQSVIQGIMKNDKKPIIELASYHSAGLVLGENCLVANLHLIVPSCGVNGFNAKNLKKVTLSNVTTKYLTTDFEDLTIEENQAFSPDIYVENVGELTLENCDFHHPYIDAKMVNFENDNNLGDIGYPQSTLNAAISTSQANFLQLQNISLKVTGNFPVLTASNLIFQKGSQAEIERFQPLAGAALVRQALAPNGNYYDKKHKTDGNYCILANFGELKISELLAPATYTLATDQVGEDLPVLLKKEFLFKNSGQLTISGENTVTYGFMSEISQGSQTYFKNYSDVNRWAYFDGGNFELQGESTVKVVAKNQAGQWLPYQDWLTEKAEEKRQSSAIYQLENMTGLAQAKEQMMLYIASARANQRRKALGQKVSSASLHMIFAGNAGTGKTTVARLVAQILYENGVIAENKLTEVSAKDLVAGYIGQTATKTHEVIEKALGGILFIDEAYQLATKDDTGSNAAFKEEAINQLIADMENNRDKLIVIIAGYSAEIKDFLQSNQGLSSRFTNWIDFEDYSAEELIAIAEKQLLSESQVCDKEASETLAKVISDAKSQHLVDGNARYVRNLLQLITQSRDARIFKKASFSDAELNQIIREDVEAGAEKAQNNSNKMN
ncbi:AAA family ATPase [Lactococcus nasutitermitis]|uniref:AAA family ATPase n=1 Tax=Lactococcus nasutitermitis TaxID=1652957 RepID=A0ABV9JCQ4_9LACT|nr:AAA family ATPase [Lactococcus nasutitermitis]